MKLREYLQRRDEFMLQKIYDLCVDHYGVSPGAEQMTEELSQLFAEAKEAWDEHMSKGVPDNLEDVIVLPEVARQ